MTPWLDDGDVQLVLGDCVEAMAAMPEASVDAVVCDPPYGLGFMGAKWDTYSGETTRQPSTRHGFDHVGGNHNPVDSADSARTRRAEGKRYQEWCETWAVEALRVLKPGGHLLAFGGTRTYHRLTCAVEDAGFEVRDCLCWLYGSGFPKSLDVSKAIDKASRGVPQGGADPTSEHHGQYRTTTTEGKRWDGDSGQGYGAGGSRFLTTTASERTAPRSDAASADGEPSRTLDATASEWDGWGTALKPAYEPIVLARRPLTGTVAANVQQHGTGALNIGGCRIEHRDDADLAESVAKNQHTRYANPGSNRDSYSGQMPPRTDYDGAAGRWPANVVLDETAAALLDEQSGETSERPRTLNRNGNRQMDGWGLGAESIGVVHGDSGGASRFFYTAKASRSERGDENTHPTVKPVALMRWLCRLVTPPGGLILDPFCGSGTTPLAARLEGYRCIAIDRELAYLEIAARRLGQQSLFSPTVAPAADPEAEVV